MRGDARGCSRMRGAAGAAQGFSGVASPRRRSRSWIAAASRRGGGGKSPLSPAQPSPRRARAPAGAGVGSLGTPRSHRLSSALPLSQARASVPPPPGLPPEWEGAAGPPPRPSPSRPTAAARRDAGLAARGQTTPRTDGLVSRLPDAGIPRVGGGRGRAQGRGGGRGRRRRKGRRQIATVSA